MVSKPHSPVNGRGIRRPSEPFVSLRGGVVLLVGVVCIRAWGSGIQDLGCVGLRMVQDM